MCVRSISDFGETKKNVKIETPKSQLGTWPGVKSVLPSKRARFLPKINAIKVFGT